jgi:hypothetical protein
MDRGEESNTLIFDSGGWENLSEKSIGSESLVNLNPLIQLNTVVDQKPERLGRFIDRISYDFEKVKISVRPGQEHDTSSVRLIAQLPDQSFRSGNLISNQNGEYSFAFPVQVSGDYHFTLTFTSDHGEEAFREEIVWEIEIADGFKLSSNYPNPFNPTTNIPITLIEGAEIGWQVFDILGRKVMEFPPEQLESGEHVKPLDFNGFPSGVYLVRARLERDRNPKPIYRTMKVMLIK